MKRLILSGIASCFYCCVVTAQVTAPFRKGDKVMFVGNSITDAGFYHSYIWLYYMTRFPDQRITIYNRGIGGDDAGQMYDRLETEVFNDQPTVVALTFGMNDSGYFEYLQKSADSVRKEKVARSYQSFLKIEKTFNSHPGVRKIIFTSPPYDETTKAVKNNYFPGKTKAMQEIVAFQQEIAAKNHWPLIDLFNPMSAINSSNQAKDSLFTLGGGDRIHPGMDGHLVMAWLFLKAQGLAGKNVADITVDASTGKVLNAGNCSITALANSKQKLQFTYLAKALPFPVDTIPRMWNSNSKQSDALKLIPFSEELNQEKLQVKGLDKASYVVRVDETIIDKFSSDELASGINLALYMNTPQYRQAIQVRELNQERMEIEKRLRQYNWVEFDVLKQRGLLRKNNDAAVDTVMSLAKDAFIRGNMENWTKARYAAIRQVWQDEMDMLVNTIYKVNKPVPHRIIIEKEK